MNVAYADPPYIGQAKKHYSHDPNCAEVDHVKLIEQLNTFDAWALSASSVSLRVILPMCPPDVRVLSWVKPFCAFKANVGVAYAWEPVIVRGGRKRTRQQPTMRDWLAENITLKKGLSGVKPLKFSWWLFEVMNMEPQDEFSDLFIGSGAVTEAWIAYRELKAKTSSGIISNHIQEPLKQLL